MVHNGHRVWHHGRVREGLGVLGAANIGNTKHEVDAETTPLRNPEHYQYELNLRTSRRCGDAAV